MVQWARLHAPNAGGPGLIPGQGTRSCVPQLRVLMLQLRVHMPQLRSPHAATMSLHATAKKKKIRMLQ